MIRRVTSVRILLTALCFVGVWAAMTVTAVAQVYVGHEIPRGGNVEISGGLAWAGGYDLGSISAEETRNTGTGTGSFVLFGADSKMNSQLTSIATSAEAATGSSAPACARRCRR